MTNEIKELAKGSLTLAFGLLVFVAGFAGLLFGSFALLPMSVSVDPNFGKGLFLFCILVAIQLVAVAYRFVLRLPENEAGDNARFVGWGTFGLACLVAIVAGL